MRAQVGYHVESSRRLLARRAVPPRRGRSQGGPPLEQNACPYSTNVNPHPFPPPDWDVTRAQHSRGFPLRETDSSKWPVLRVYCVLCLICHKEQQFMYIVHVQYCTRARERGRADNGWVFTKGKYISHVTTGMSHERKENDHWKDRIES